MNIKFYKISGIILLSTLCTPTVNASHYFDKSAIFEKDNYGQFVQVCKGENHCKNFESDKNNRFDNSYSKRQFKNKHKRSNKHNRKRNKCSSKSKCYKNLK